MRAPATNRGRSLRFNITPLIDIVFLLVIFFLVSTHFVNSEHREEVALPEATESDERPAAPRRLVINVLVDGALRVNGRAVTIDDVRQLIAEEVAAGTDDYEVQIRGDRDVPYDKVEPLLLACAQQGVTRIGFKKLDR